MIPNMNMMSNMNSVNNSMLSISSLKDKMKWIIPSSMQKPLNTFLDLLDISYKLKNTNNPSLIGNISTLLTQIIEFIKQKVTEMNLKLKKGCGEAIHYGIYIIKLKHHLSGMLNYLIMQKN